MSDERAKHITAKDIQSFMYYRIPTQDGMLPELERAHPKHMSNICPHNEPHQNETDEPADAGGENAISRIKHMIETTMKLTDNQISVENMAGNFVKESCWRGEHTGLRKALLIIDEVLSTPAEDVK